MSEESLAERRVIPCRREDCPIKLELEQEIKDINYAFPDGPVKHREAHEQWMAAKKAEKDFYDSLKQEVMKKGVAGVFALIVILLGFAVSGMLYKAGLLIHLSK